VFQSLVTALVLPHLDYYVTACCIWSAHYTDPASLLCTECQLVRRCAAHIRYIRRSEHIFPALISLHWLRIPERISFKLAVLTFRAIHGAEPSYPQSCFTLVADMSSRRRLRSSGSDRLHVGLPVIRRSTVGSRTSQFLALRYGTTCRLMSQLRRHSRSSDSASRHFCFRINLYPDIVI